MTIKTTKTDLSVVDFLESLDDEMQVEDAKKLLQIFEKATGEKAYIWGTSIIGFGEYDYVSAKGYSKCKWFHCGFSPRKGKFSLYFSASVLGEKELLEKLGKYKNAKACLYVNKLDDVELDILKKLIKKGFELSLEQSKKS